MKRLTVQESQAALAALALYVCQRLTGVLPRRAADPAKQAGMVIVGAAAPFAPTPHARARLLRQLHASGLLSDREVSQTREILGVAR